MQKNDESAERDELLGDVIRAHSRPFDVCWKFRPEELQAAATELGCGGLGLGSSGVVMSALAPRLYMTPALVQRRPHGSQVDYRQQPPHRSMMMIWRYAGGAI